MGNEVQSQTAYVLEPILPWEAAVRADDDSALESVALFEDGYRRDCLLRNVSPLGATVKGDVRLAPGAEVSLELPTGQRPKAVAEWVEGGDAGLRFDQPVSVIPLINRQLLSQPVERRRVPRVEIRARAWVESDGEFIEAALRNISSHGLQIEAAGLPGIGTTVRIFLEGLNAPAAKLIWKDGDVAGLELSSELPWATTIQWIRDFARSSQTQEPLPS